MYSGHFLEKMMESMIMEMINNQRRGPSPSACSNQTCMAKPEKKTRKRRRHCKKKRSKCSADVASIICVTKCLSKCKESEEKSSAPCCHNRKSKNALITKFCSSDSCASDPKYCSKCGQPLPGSNGVAQKNSLNEVHLYRDTQSKINAKGIASPEETCISCYTKTSCTPCNDGISPVRFHQNIVSQCAPEDHFFRSPYFFRNLTNSKPKCSRFTGAENQPENVCIKTFAKTIVPMRCDGDINVSRTEIENNVGKNRGNRTVNCGNERGDREKTCSRRFIQLTTDRKSNFGRNCITNVECSDYSSTTSGSRANTAAVPAMSATSISTPGNTDIVCSPCSDRGPPAAKSNPALDHPSTPHVVRIRLANHCQPTVKSYNRCEIHTEDYESDCDKQPCTCCATNTSRPVVPFCYDPATDQYEDEFGDIPCNCIDGPNPTYSLYPHNCPQPAGRTSGPLPVYNDPYEYRPAPSTAHSESSGNTSTQESLPPEGRYGYDFFYGSVKRSH